MPGEPAIEWLGGWRGRGVWLKIRENGDLQMRAERSGEGRKMDAVVSMSSHEVTHTLVCGRDAVRWGGPRRDQV